MLQNNTAVTFMQHIIKKTGLAGSLLNIFTIMYLKTDSGGPLLHL